MFEDLIKAIAEKERVRGTSHSAAVTNIDDISDIIDSINCEKTDC